MKTIICLTIFLAVISTIANAITSPDASRKVSTGLITANGIITSQSVYLYDFEIQATAAGGYATLYNDSSGNESTSNQLTELTEGTQYNGKHVNYGEDGKYAGEGLEVELKNATAIAYYH